MKKIIPFSTLKDYIHFLSERKCHQIGEGAEGKCYLSDLDGYVYKVITNVDNTGKRIGSYDASKIITTQDIKLSHYILPDELYVIDNEVIGYRTKYIKEKNIFEEYNPKEIIKQLSNLKEQILINAYHEIREETDILSKAQIEIYDLTYNLLFTGQKYYGIDTCGYERTEENILTYNREYLDDAIRENFCTMLYKTQQYSDESISELDYKEDMEEYSKGLIKLIKKRN